jgi:hypothetical protein
MWILFARAARPDAIYWPGRRWLAAVDAVLWPAALVIALINAPFSAGVVGMTAVALASLAAVRRTHRAIWRNERYQFTTWRWGAPLLALIGAGAVMRLMA